MCGIGLWYKNNSQIDRNAFASFMHRIDHRGKDAQSIIDLTDKCIIATNRLAIIDAESRSNQPFQYKNYTLSFNGAIYNFKAIRDSLLSKGHIFITESDTEVILHAYEEYGTDCSSIFEGMWAFVIYDQENDLIFASRDRFHIKPLYYVHTDEGIYIGSELKQFRELPDFPYKINEKHVQYYLESGGFKNYNNQCFIQDIIQLEGGNNIIYDCNRNNLEIQTYYSLRRNENILNESLTSLLSKAIQKRLVGDEQAGLLLSGGLDSSILGLTLHKTIKHLKSYSFIEGRDPRMDESLYLKDFLAQYPHENHRVVLPADLPQQLIEECIYYQDEPPASLSTIAQFLLYKLASSNKEKLILSGQGADELFGGYPKFLSYLPMSSWLKNPPSAIAVIPTLFNRFLSSNSTSLFKNSSSQLSSYNSDSSYMYHLMYKNGLRDLLHSEDRNSMANGIETRLPFLDTALVEYAYTMSFTEKMKGAKRKGVLLDSYKDKLPKSIINRKRKIAFDTPEKFLLQQGFFDSHVEYKKLRESLPNLPWKKNTKIIYRASEFTQWQVYFLNIWISQLE